MVPYQCVKALNRYRLLLYIFKGTDEGNLAVIYMALNVWIVALFHNTEVAVNKSMRFPELDALTGLRTQSKLTST